MNDKTAFDKLQNIILRSETLDYLDSVDIGRWYNYNYLLDSEQCKLQEENLISTGVYNSSTEVKFIFTKYMEKLNNYLNDVSQQIRVIDTVVALEDEVFYTSKIEGAKTTRIRTSEIHNGLPINEGNAYSEQMVSNGFKAVKLLNLYGHKLTEDILLKVWSILVDGICENESIRGERYRIGDVCVGNYEAPEWSKVDKLMGGFIEFHNSSDLKRYPFIKAALIHYIFETIHPFPDGNGRLGRLLVNNFLLKEGIGSAAAVSFAMQIDRNRSKYDVAFIDSENDHNDCTPFLEFMLEMMCNAYELVYEIQHKL